MTTAEFAIATQHHLDRALDAIAEDERAEALIQLAAVEEYARRTAAAIHAEARAHVIAEAVAACAAPVPAFSLLGPNAEDAMDPFGNIESGDLPAAPAQQDAPRRSSQSKGGHALLFPLRVGLVLSRSIH